MKNQKKYLLITTLKHVWIQTTFETRLDTKEDVYIDEKSEEISPDNDFETGLDTKGKEVPINEKEEDKRKY